MFGTEAHSVYQSHTSLAFSVSESMLGLWVLLNDLRLIPQLPEAEP